MLLGSLPLLFSQFYDSHHHVVQRKTAPASVCTDAFCAQVETGLSLPCVDGLPSIIDILTMMAVITAEIIGFSGKSSWCRSPTL